MLVFLILFISIGSGIAYISTGKSRYSPTISIAFPKSINSLHRLTVINVINNNNRNNQTPKSPLDISQVQLSQLKSIAFSALAFGISRSIACKADEIVDSSSIPIKANENVVSQPPASTSAVESPAIDWGSYKLPYNHENLDFKNFLGKATILFNMKIDDPQTVTQFPSLLEIFQKYSGDGLNVLGFPTEQGWFEPDDDETCREKAKVYYGFGAYPHAAIFDKIDVLGPSAHPMITALSKALPTPNGYGRITLNYEKFLLDSTGKPLRRYPRKFSAYDMEPDIIAVLKGEPLPPESPGFLKAWREAKRESVKSEYAFRYNYNYYDSPESMYKYNSAKDKL